jgi:acetolactate synthase-1/2/3 large subunit
VLIDQLLIHGVDTVFCVPGESYLAATDAMYDAADRIRLFVARQEGGAATMAEAYGKLTNRPGICFVTRGPGATNASIGVHTARQDSTPMILFVGQVSSDQIGREAFQELDYAQVFGGLAKWATQVDDAARLPEIVHRAFTVATSGRAGPVVIALPENVLRSVVVVDDARRYTPVQASPSAESVIRLGRLVAAAERPLLLVGGSGWTQDAATRVTRFAEQWNIPAVTSFRRQDLIDHRSESYAGTLGPGAGEALLGTVAQADLLLVVGARLGELTTADYSVPEAPRPVQQLVHVHAGVEELGRVYQPDLAIVSGMPQFAEALAALHPPATRTLGWDEWRAKARAAQVERSTVRSRPDGLDAAAVVAHISATVPADTVVTNGAGNYTAWVHRYYRFTQHPTQLGPTSGAMGYGLPAALAAKIVHPDRICIAFHGDGCLMMTVQELATAAQYGLDVIVVVVNNGRYGTIRMHQEMRYPGRTIATELTNPDFVALARSFGLHAERVEVTAAFPDAFSRALSAGRAALIELVTDPDQSTPDAHLSAITAAASRATEPALKES